MALEVPGGERGGEREREREGGGGEGEKKAGEGSIFSSRQEDSGKKELKRARENDSPPPPLFSHLSCSGLKVMSRRCELVVCHCTSSRGQVRRFHTTSSIRPGSLARSVRGGREG